MRLIAGVGSAPVATFHSKRYIVIYRRLMQLLHEEGCGNERCNCGGDCSGRATGTAAGMVPRGRAHHAQRLGDGDHLSGAPVHHPPYVSGGSLALWVGVLESVNAFCAFLVAPFLGGLSDRIGRRPILILGAFGAALGYVLFGIGGALWVLIVGRIIQGLTAGDMPALFAYVADITPAGDRAKRYGFLGALSGIGFMVGPALGGLLAKISLSAPIFATAAVAALVGVISLVILPESLAAENRSSKLSLGDLHPLRVIRDAFSRKGLAGLLVGYTLITIPFMFYVNNVSVLALDSVGWGPTQVGLMVSGVGVVDIIIQGGLLAVLLPKIGERGVVLGGISVQAIGCLGLALSASVFRLPWLLAAACLLLAAGEGGMTAALNGLMSASVGPDEQGWLAGSVSSIGSAIQMTAPLLPAGCTRSPVTPSRTGQASR